jgi:hypothetical protein
LVEAGFYKPDALPDAKPLQTEECFCKTPSCCTKMRDNSNSVTGQGVRPAVSTSKIRVGSVKVGTMKSRGSEIVEMLTRRKIDICCVQETR